MDKGHPEIRQVPHVSKHSDPISRQDPTRFYGENETGVGDSSYLPVDIRGALGRNQNSHSVVPARSDNFRQNLR